MIMVVALLVLMALMGTAYIATARYDRGSADQNQSNVQVDLLLESVLNMAKTAVAGDLYGHDNSPTPQYVFRPAEPMGGWNHPPGATTGKLEDTFYYFNLTSTGVTPTPTPTGSSVPPGIRYDPWLADRTPTATDYTNIATPGPYVWQRISQALISETELVGTVATPVRGYFEDPTYYPDTNRPIHPTNNPAILRFNNDTDLTITSKLFSGRVLPAFAIPTSIPTLPTYNALAADTDGDGVGDALFFRLPVGIINGVTYYAAVRIVDNTAAVNINTAWADIAPLDTTGTVTSDGRRILPNSINLSDFIPGTTAQQLAEFDKIREYRIQAPGPSYAHNSGVTVNLDFPRSDKDPDNARTDFLFFNEHDAQWMQLQRRFENPGFIPVPGTPTPFPRYRAFPISDMLPLASRFVVAPNYPSGLSEAVLFTTLQNPLLDASGQFRLKPYEPGDIETVNGLPSDYSWAHQNFWYGDPAAAPTRDYSRRPLIVTTNAVSTGITINPMPTGNDLNNDGIDNDPPNRDMLHFFPIGKNRVAADFNSRTTYRKGDVVAFGGLTYIYVADNPSQTGNPDEAAERTHWELQPVTRYPVKTNPNTATFRELYRAYWNVMSGNDGASTPFTNFATDNNPYDHIDHPQRMFRSSLRDVRLDASGNFDNSTYRFSPFNQLLLRAALAAINTIDLRDADDDITSRQITLRITDDAGAPRNVEVTLFGSERQPFMTEVFISNDKISGNTANSTSDPNPKGYVAVEFFNPYDTDLSLNNWKVAVVDRRRPASSASAAQHTLDDTRVIHTFGSGDIIKPGKYLVIENYDRQNATKDTDSARHDPPGTTVTTTDNRYVYIRHLYKVFEDPPEPGGELILLRPRRANGTISTSSAPANQFDENDVWDLVPVEQFDFTGMKYPPPPPNPGDPVEVETWHYTRGSGTGGNRWKCVFGGRYNGGKTTDKNRHDANVTKYNAPWQLITDATSTPRLILGAQDTTLTVNPNTLPPIQINNTDFPGPMAITGPTDPNNPKRGGGTPKRINMFPFGGFMRVGDLMQVPFIGAYRVRELDPGGSLRYSDEVFLELNSMSMDSVFAEDTASTNDQYENVGRFCPIIPQLTSTALGTDATYYDFARKLHNNFSVITPHADYFPHVDPSRARDPLKNETAAYRFFNGTSYEHIVKPDPDQDAQRSVTTGMFPPANDEIPIVETVRNVDTGSSIITNEDTLGVHGLININTANRKVLATIPWDPPASTMLSNEDIANAIVDYRDGAPFAPVGAPNAGKGPFRSIFDLYKIPEIVAAQKALFGVGGTDPDDADGDFSPYNHTGNPKDGVADPYDFEQHYLFLNRISNLITTRSDSFTAYVVVQGWRNANTDRAEMVVQRRAALLIDRSAVRHDSGALKTMLIPIE
jgi:hypothetical protein